MTASHLIFLAICPTLLCGVSWAFTTAYRTRTHRSTFNKIFAAKLDLMTNVTLIFLALLAASCTCVQSLTDIAPDIWLKTMTYSSILLTSLIAGVRLSRHQLVVEIEVAAEKSKMNAARVL